MAGRFKYDGLHQPIMTTARVDDFESGGFHKPTWSCSVYVIVVIISMSSTIGLDTIWLTSSRSTNQIPPDENLRNYLIGFFVFGNLSVLVYMLIYVCFLHRRHCTEVLTIYGCILLALVTAALAAVFWEDQAGLWYKQHGMFYICMAVSMSVVACLSTVTHVPFVARLKPVYLSAVFTGETIARLSVHLVAIGQGIGEQPACRVKSPANRSWILLTGWRARLRPTTTQAPVIPPALRFNESIFYFVVTGVLCLSTFSFFVLRCFPAIRFEYDNVPVDTMEELCESTQTSSILTRSENGDHIPMRTIEASTSDYVAANCEGLRPSSRGISASNYIRGSPKTHKLLQNKSRLLNKDDPHITKPNHQGPQISACKSSMLSIEQTPRRVVKLKLPRLTKRQAPSPSRLSPYQPMSKCLLLSFTFWACVVVSGPLSPTKAYACLPRGNRAFQSGTLLTQLTALLAVFVSTRVNPYSRVPMVVAFTSLATIVLTYFVALISFSHESESREDSPIFMNTGELLTTMAWSSVVGLFMFTRCTVALLLRQHQNHMLIWFSAVSLLGMTLGALFMLNNINICRIYRDYEELYCKSSG